MSTGQQPYVRPPSCTTGISPRLRETHDILAPNEHSSATIGIHSLLVRHSENDFFRDELEDTIKRGSELEECIGTLCRIERKLRLERQLSSERSTIIARLLKYLEQDKIVFQGILEQINEHIKQCLRDEFFISSPTSCEDLFFQCKQREAVVLEHCHAYCKQRFQIYDGNKSMSIIELQRWILMHFDIFLRNTNISPNVSIRTELLKQFDILFDNSFFVVQQPTPAIQTIHSEKNKSVWAKISCKILCLLDTSDLPVTIANIIPVVHRVNISDEHEETNVGYRQKPIAWKSHSITTSSNTRTRVSCSELSRIVFEEDSKGSEEEKSVASKIHYTPIIYYIDFHIKITVRFPDSPSPHYHNVILRSSPFGLVIHTSQAENLFADVFIEDLKFCKKNSLEPSTTVSNLTTNSSATTNSFFSDILIGIEHYFTYKTGIYPKSWVKQSIKNELLPVYQRTENPRDKDFQKLLQNVLAQIDFMAEHLLLTFFYEDGLFAFHNTEPMDNVLTNICVERQIPIFAIRFGSIRRMANSKDVSIRMDRVTKYSVDLKRYTFDPKRLPLQLTSFIIQVASYPSSHSKYILSNIIVYGSECSTYTLTKISKFVELYYNPTLRRFCPDEEKYQSWEDFLRENNSAPNDSDSSQVPTEDEVSGVISLQSSNYSMLSDTRFYPSTITTSDQYEPMLQQYTNPTNTSPPSTTLINHENGNSNPIIIVITSTAQFAMSNETIAYFVANHLPQYSSMIQHDRIHQLNADTWLNSPDTSENLFPNLPLTFTSSNPNGMIQNNGLHPVDSIELPNFDDNDL